MNSYKNIFVTSTHLWCVYDQFPKLYYSKMYMEMNWQPANINIYSTRASKHIFVELVELVSYV